ncbi:DUF3108 domain-containing protein [Paraflavisolibacter sp. H34]|uniref:DUF3108 domain-containing protein n=1 Tax=Huijunlia imazamoxiresistens TaxID=3127457 RepID=UPI0030168F74
MKLYNYALVLLCGLAGTAMTKPLRPQEEFCGIHNTAFSAGEQLTYTVYYNVAGAFINAGTATFNNALEKLGGKTVYHMVAEGKTNPSYDWIFKVRDRYESYIDTGSMQPLKFIRNVDEGGYKKYENITFNRSASTAVTNNGVFKVPGCVQDVVSSMYYARNINFNKYKAGDRIPFTMFLDNEVYHMYIRYLGKEEVKTRYGRFTAIKFKPLLVKGNIFEGGEKMTVWVSDDNNHIPLRIESPIIVGSIKVDMMSYRNLRYPLSSLKKARGM